MRMTYRCKSCGSNATASLTCEHCGAGTVSRTSRKAPQPVNETPMQGLLLVVGTMTATVALLLIGGVL